MSAAKYTKADFPDLPKGVYVKSDRFYAVRRNKWLPLTKCAEGLPALRLAFSKLEEEAAALKAKKALPPSSMGPLIEAWQRDVMSGRSEQRQREDRARCKVIFDGLCDFTASEITPSAVKTFLKPWASKARTHNEYRGLLRELMRYAEENDMRPPGSNPTGAIKTARTHARKRYITDSELRRIKVAAMRGSARYDDASTMRSGPMLCCLIDMAYLTGQAIGDLLDMRWSRDAEEPAAPHLQEGGVWFSRKKLSKTTREEVLIEWSPRLRDVIRRLKVQRLARPGASEWLFTMNGGQRATYAGMHTAYTRAVKRAGIEGCTFHDLRAKALTDKEAREGMQQARIMGSHSTEQQTADYVRNKTTRTTRATR